MLPTVLASLIATVVAPRPDLLACGWSAQAGVPLLIRGAVFARAGDRSVDLEDAIIELRPARDGIRVAIVDVPTWTLWDASRAVFTERVFTDCDRDAPAASTTWKCGGGGELGIDVTETGRFHLAKGHHFDAWQYATDATTDPSWPGVEPSYFDVEKRLEACARDGNLRCLRFGHIGKAAGLFRVHWGCGNAVISEHNNWARYHLDDRDVLLRSGLDLVKLARGLVLQLGERTFDLDDIGLSHFVVATLSADEINEVFGSIADDVELDDANRARASRVWVLARSMTESQERDAAWPNEATAPTPIADRMRITMSRIDHVPLARASMTWEMRWDSPPSVGPVRFNWHRLAINAAKKCRERFDNEWYCGAIELLAE